MESIWKRIDDRVSITLDSDIERDIVVVGGGIAGFLTAYHLAKGNRKVTLVESKTLFSGVTRKTTAHIEALQGIKYTNFNNKKTAKLYYESQIEAINEYQSIVKKYNIDCDFKRLDSYLYTHTNVERLKKEFDTLHKIGADVSYIEKPKVLNNNASAAICMRNQAAFEPIKFLTALPIDFEVFENTTVIDFDYKGLVLFTLKHKIRAKKIIIATNYPIINVPGWFFLRMYKSTSYVAAIKKEDNIGGLYQDDKDAGYTFRNYKDNLIVGGLDHRTGRLDTFDKFKQLEEKGGGKATHKWLANDCITFDYLPYIGYYCKKSRDVYIISGFNKWGMASAMIGSMLLSDMIYGIKNKYEHLFSPQRSIPINCRFLKNAMCVVKDIAIKPLTIPLKKHNSLHNGEGDIVMYHGKKRAVYKDEDGNYHICHYLCAHLKCQLQFNPNEKTWDCPCHGSRFDIDGNLLIAPSVKNLYNYNKII